MPDVVVTGVGAVSPLGVGARTLHARWAAGECGLRDGLGRVEGFDPGEYMSSRDVRRIDPFCQYAIVAAEEALGQAGWLPDRPYDGSDVACVMGTGQGGAETTRLAYAVGADRGLHAIPPYAAPAVMPNAAAATLSIRYGLCGESLGVASACAAGTQAVGVGYRMVRHGLAKAAVVGGAEAVIVPIVRATFETMGATSKLGVSRPFDARRDGFVLAEGAGVLVLEDAEEAARRGAQPVAEVLGYGGSSDAFHMTAPAPQAKEIARAITRALDDAGVAADELAYVNAHGTSTQLNDASETLALKQALGPAAARVPISSTKSVVGHMGGAAGAVEALATIHALRERVAPPTVGLEEPDPECDLDYVPGEARALASPPDGGRLKGISNSFGFGGHNAVLVLAA